MVKFFEEFKKFIVRGNVIDLAVAVVIGAAFAKIIDALVADIFMPVIGLATGGFDVSGKSVVLHGDAKLLWGHFVQMVINFVIIGFCLFLVVKGTNVLQARMKKAEEAKPPEPTASEMLLMEIRDLLKAKA